MCGVEGARRRRVSARRSPLWALGDKIWITAHNADLTEDYFDLGWAVFADNYRSFASGEPLKTPIEVSRGY